MYGAPGGQAWGHPQPPPKKGTSGWVIALGIVGGVVFLGIVVVVVAVVAFMRSDIGQTTIKVVGASKHLIEKGTAAPGAANVRAMGCDQALVWTMADFQEMMDAFDASVGAGRSPDDVMVMCQVQGMHPPPKCDDVAATYVTAVGGSANGEITVIVQQQGNNHPICQDRYDSSGSYLGAGSSSTPPGTL